MFRPETSPLTCPDCNYVMASAEFTCPRCASVKDPVDLPIFKSKLFTDAPATHACKARAVRFAPVSPEQIENKAKASLQNSIEKSNRRVVTSIKLTWWMPFAGVFAIARGGAGAAIGAVLWSVFLCIISFGILNPVLGDNISLDEKQLAIQRRLWRNMRSGPCPVCKDIIVTSPKEDPLEFRCPYCHEMLLFTDGYVSPRSHAGHSS